MVASNGSLADFFGDIRISFTSSSLSSLVTRPGFSFREPRRAASAGLVRKVKIYHISSELRDLDGFGGARIVYLNDVMSYFKYIIG